MEAVEIRRVGASALLLAVDDPLAWFASLVRLRAQGRLRVTDIVPGARTVLLDGVDDPLGVAENLRESSATPGTVATPEKSRKIPVSYRGSDLPFVAEHWGLSVDAAVARVAGVEFTVAFCGFAPGFAYLTGLADEWAVPRLATPRARVPVGAVALAGEYAGIYPSASPGGWRLIGSTEVRLFDPEQEPPALLTPGTRVRLVPE
jgi:KipI family sensor histidine kinase inhibitor